MIDMVRNAYYNANIEYKNKEGIMATAKWTRKLTKKDLRHLAEGSSSGRPTLHSLKANLAGQRELNAPCFECLDIARKLSIAVPTA